MMAKVHAGPGLAKLSPLPILTAAEEAYEVRLMRMVCGYGKGLQSVPRLDDEEPLGESVWAERESASGKA
jgi:hypothetical protein